MESDQPAALRYDGVSKTWGQGEAAVAAVAGLDLAVPAGASIAIMGPSGSGKSTLLHLAAGLTSPDAGRILVAGRELAGLDDEALSALRRRELGVVFQAFNLLPTLDAADNAALPLVLNGVPHAAARSRAAEMLTAVGLARRLGHRPDQLSGGEQQRVAIVRALLPGPDLILADEPTGNLDSVSARQVLDLLTGRAGVERRPALVVVTHEAAVAVALERTVLLRDGRIIADIANAGLDGPALAARCATAIAAGQP